jgi:hypothetical protein
VRSDRGCESILSRLGLSLLLLLQLFLIQQPCSCGLRVLLLSHSIDLTSAGGLLAITHRRNINRIKCTLLCMLRLLSMLLLLLLLLRLLLSLQLLLLSLLLSKVLLWVPRLGMLLLSLLLLLNEMLLLLVMLLLLLLQHLLLHHRIMSRSRSSLLLLLLKCPKLRSERTRRCTSGIASHSFPIRW